MRKSLELQQDSALELQSLRLVVKNQDNLPGLSGKIRLAKNRPSQTRRKTLAKRKKRDQADGTSSNCFWLFCLVFDLFLVMFIPGGLQGNDLTILPHYFYEEY